MKGSNSEKTAVFFSNPFGFGPTGKAVALIKEFKKVWKGEIIFACSEFCETLINDPNIAIISINERDESEIERLLEQIKNPFVISCLNRFAVKVAHQKHIPCVMVDSLMWFWNKLPPDFALADHYYVQNIPGSEKNLPEELKSKVIFVPAIVGDLPKRKAKKHLLFHIGGCQNPLHKALQTRYLDLLAELFNYADSLELPEIYLAGGPSAVHYLKDKYTGKNTLIHFVSFERDQFLDTLAACRYFITTSGLTATLEAFTIGVPTAFYLPSNLSQWALLIMLKNHSLANKRLQWEDYVEVSESSRISTEGEAMPLIEIWADQIMTNQFLFEKVKGEFFQLFDENIQTVAQKKFINEIGSQGVEKIVQDLQMRWNF